MTWIISNLDRDTAPPLLAGDGELVPRALADFECKHGRLSGDSTPPCGCWPAEARNAIDELAAIRERAIAEGKVAA